MNKRLFLTLAVVYGFMAIFSGGCSCSSGGDDESGGESLEWSTWTGAKPVSMADGVALAYEIHFKLMHCSPMRSKRITEFIDKIGIAKIASLVIPVIQGVEIHIFTIYDLRSIYYRFF